MVICQLRSVRFTLGGEDGLEVVHVEQLDSLHLSHFGLTCICTHKCGVSVGNERFGHHSGM